MSGALVPADEFAAGAADVSGAEGAAGPAGWDDAPGPAVAPAAGRTPVPGARSIRRYTARVARRRSGAGIGEVLGDVYYAVVMTAIGLGVALGLAGHLRTTLPHVPDQALRSGISLPTVVAVVAVVVAGVVLSLSARLGPVGAGGAEATWWLGTPVDRRGLLRPASLRLPVAAGLVGGVVLALLDGGLLADHGLGHVLRLGAGAALVCAALVLLAGHLQSRGVPRRATALAGDAVIAAAPVLALVAALAGWRVAALPDVAWWVLVALAAAVAGAGFWLDTRLGRIRGRDLRESGSVASQAAGALVSLDSRELGRALSDSAARPRRRRVRRMRLVRGPVSAVVVADLTVLLRSPRHLVQLVVSALVPVVVVITPQLAGAVGVVLAVLVSGYVGMLATGEGARRAEMAPVVDRLLPLSAQAVRRARLIVPGVAMLLWSVASFAAVGRWEGAVGPWLLLGVVSAPVWAAASLRAAYRPSPNWEGPLVATPMGALPGGVAAVLARGPDVAVLGMVPVVLSVALGTVLPVVVAVQAGVSAIALAVGASTSTKTMMDRMAEATDAAEAEKKRGTR
ncbi:DUF6297 family protein [Cellulomonas pakistanensis]|uniref:Uncharacterized protein n=1 Tax=Cellulomonas pakistanensis TaxID=992287 RepID=A0A919PF51_9CELL|nr:DUF6297 family protein [Cellulomonas pakistanensis]GIG37417.1 hypothetical protein Cpa01nite_27980 [Cellulomonas pakistanensis]